MIDQISDDVRQLSSLGTTFQTCEAGAMLMGIVLCVCKPKVCIRQRIINSAVGLQSRCYNLTPALVQRVSSIVIAQFLHQLRASKPSSKLNG